MGINKYLGSAVCGVLVTVTGLAIWPVAQGHPLVGRSPGDVPDKLAGFSALVHFTPAEVQALKAGQPVSKPLESDDREVRVFGVVWINAPVSKYVEAINHIERLEQGNGFQITRRISDPPRLEDFANLQLPEGDVQELRKCRPGKCDVKLDEYAINRIQNEVDWSKPTATEDVNALLRQLALRYVTAYQQGGNKELGINRDKSRPTDVAKEFEEMINAMPLLAQREPGLRQYLLDYPNAAIPNSTSFFYWQQVNFGLKPVIRMNHVITTANAERVLVASKQIYASHYFWTALEIRDLIPDPSRGNGFWFADVSSGRAGTLASFKGKMIRGRVQKEALKGLAAGMEKTKSLLEQEAR
jgi:hypothetical protein